MPRFSSQGRFERVIIRAKAEGEAYRGTPSHSRQNSERVALARWWHAAVTRAESRPSSSLLKRMEASRDGGAEAEASKLTYRLLREGTKDIIRRCIRRSSGYPCNGALLWSALNDMLPSDGLKADALMSALATVLRESVGLTMTMMVGAGTRGANADDKLGGDEEAAAMIRGVKIWIAALTDAWPGRLRNVGTLLNRPAAATTTTKRKRRPDISPVGRVWRVVATAIAQTKALVGLRDAIGAVDAVVEVEWGDGK